jgi:hypothetical protein
MNCISWWLMMSIGKCMLKDRSKSSIQWSGCFYMNRGFQGKHLYAGVNVCILNVFHERVVALNIGCYEACCIYIVFFWVLSQYSPVIGFWYCTGILCCQLKGAFASLPTVWAVRHVPQGLWCLFPFGHLLHPWDLHDGYLKVLKLCVLVQWHYFIWQLSFVTSCHLCTLHVYGWLSWLRFSVFFPSLSRQMPVQHLKLGHNNLLLHPFQFVINQSPYHLTLYFLSYWQHCDCCQESYSCLTLCELLNFSCFQQGIVLYCETEDSGKTMNGFMHRVILLFRWNMDWCSLSKNETSWDQVTNSVEMKSLLDKQDI